MQLEFGLFFLGPSDIPDSCFPTHLWDALQAKPLLGFGTLGRSTETQPVPLRGVEKHFGLCLGQISFGTVGKNINTDKFY